MEFMLGFAFCWVLGYFTVYREWKEEVGKLKEQLNIFGVSPEYRAKKKTQFKKEDLH